MKTTLSKNALDAMMENLAMADYAITHKKSDDDNAGCYGVSAMILLTSILDSIGTFYCLDDAANSINRSSSFNYVFKLYNNNIRNDWYHYVGNTRCHFEQVYKQFSDIIKNKGILDKDTFVDILYKVFRCGLVHNAVTNAGFLLSNASDKRVLEKTSGGTFILYVPQFLDMVKQILETFRQQHEKEILQEAETQNIDIDIPISVTGLTFDITYTILQ